MINEEFMITLPSNASVQFYPENNPSSYKVNLPKLIELEGEWEVAIVNIQYPFNWPNYKEEFIGVAATLLDMDDTGKQDFHQHSIEYNTEINKLPGAEELATIIGEYRRTITDPPPVKIVKLPTGFYRINGDIAKYVANLFNKRYLVHSREVRIKPNIECFYDSILNRVTFGGRFLKKYQFLTLSPRFHNSIGLSSENWENKLFISEPGKSEDIKTQMEYLNTMYIYCDIVKFQIVGDTQAPLLSTLVVQGYPGEQIFCGFNPPYYIPLNQKSISTIEVRICTDTGDLVPFDPSGRVIIQLHFKRHRSVW